uniref:Uncharacterized protein n=1 Tax=Romanomermis culicivorax TaxID=13658 RepID=A0A915JJM1_ROMCU
MLMHCSERTRSRLGQIRSGWVPLSTWLAKLGGGFPNPPPNYRIADDKLFLQNLHMTMYGQIDDADYEY